MSQEGVRVVVDARLTSGVPGGIEQFVIGLAHGLSGLRGCDEYLFLTYPDADDWLRPYLEGPCRLLRGRTTSTDFGLRKQLARIRPLRSSFQALSPFLGARTVRLDESDGTAEAAKADLIHFTHQRAFMSSIPNIYHPHDLQHLHLPQFFTRRQRFVREVLYRSFCSRAALVATASSWIKRDLLEHYSLPEDKVRVVPLAPVTVAYPEPTEDQILLVRHKFALPESFLLYPAQTWPHKNHIALLEAVARLRATSGLVVNLVFTGTLNDFYPKVRRAVEILGVGQQVSFLGFVAPLDLQCLYKLSTGVVIPTKFEATSSPVYEAFQAGAAVACSNVTSLPEQVGDAAIMFDPASNEAIAKAVQLLWCDASLRKTLRSRGQRRIAAFSWERTAKLFRAHYRRIAGRSLGQEDLELLNEPTPL